MIQDLQPFEISKYLNRIQKYGRHGLKGIELIQAYQLLEVAKKREQNKIYRIQDTISSNRSYPYPKEYIGKKFKY